MREKYKPRYGFTGDEIQVLELRWAMMKRSGYTVEFESFDAFVQYARGKFEYGLAMERIDKHEGWFPENIRWYNSRKVDTDISSRREYAMRWDNMMQPLRKRYAQQLAALKPYKREFFRYEHPDLVREGIVFENSQSIP